MLPGMTRMKEKLAQEAKIEPIWLKLLFISTPKQCIDALYLFQRLIAFSSGKIMVNNQTLFSKQRIRIALWLFLPSLVIIYTFQIIQLWKYSVNVYRITFNTVEPLQTGAPENRKPLETEWFLSVWNFCLLNLITPHNRKPL